MTRRHSNCWWRKHPQKAFVLSIAEPFPDIKSHFIQPLSLVLIIQDHEGLLQRRRGTRTDTQNQSACCRSPPPSGIDSCNAADLDREGTSRSCGSDTPGNQTPSDDQTHPGALKTSPFVSKADSTGRVTGLIVAAEQMWDVCCFFFFHTP